MPEAPPARDRPNARALPLRAIVLVGTLLLLVAAAAHVAGPWMPAFGAWIRSLGPWGPAVYVAAYVVATVAFVPGALPTMVAGAVFGLWEGTLWAFVGETCGGVAAFALARSAARAAIERRLGGTPRFVAIDRAVAQHGRRLVFLLRLSPAIPFNLLNYLLGLSRVRFRDYVVGSVAMLPGAFLYVYYGATVRDLAVLASGAPVERDVLGTIATVVGLVATVLVTIFVGRIVQRALADTGVPSAEPS
jgi:uncharacterized membrane protein YdjX (TVP38/TMEM64 family)